MPSETNTTETPVSAEKLIVFCDRHLVALTALRSEIEGLKRAAQSLIKKRQEQTP